MVALPVDLIQDGAFSAIQIIRRSGDRHDLQPDASSAAFISSALRYCLCPASGADGRFSPDLQEILRRRDGFHTTEEGSAIFVTT